MKILLLFVLLACVTWHACAQDNDAPSRPVTRQLLKRGQNPRGKPTTTTTPAPQDEVDYEEDEPYDSAGEVETSSEAPVSSTEGKKLLGSGVRPFRSNKDLLETLKRRRQQAMEEKTRGHSNSESSPADPVEPASQKPSYNNKKRTNSAPKDSPEEPATSKPNRGRFGRPATRSVQPEEPSSVAPSAPPAPVTGQPVDGRYSRFGRRPGH